MNNKALLSAVVAVALAFVAAVVFFTLGKDSGIDGVVAIIERRDWQRLRDAGKKELDPKVTASCARTNCAYTALLRIWVQLDAAFRNERANPRSRIDRSHYVRLLPSLRAELGCLRIDMATYMGLRKRICNELRSSASSAFENALLAWTTIEETHTAEFIALRSVALERRFSFEDKSCLNAVQDYVRGGMHISSSAEHDICMLAPHFLPGNSK